MKFIVEELETDYLIGMLRNTHDRIYNMNPLEVYEKLVDQKAKIITELYRRKVIDENEYKRFLLSEKPIYAREP